MKRRTLYFVIVFACALLLVLLTLRLRQRYPGESSVDAVSVGINDVILAEGINGDVAVIQITSIQPNAASYRWRYQSPGTGVISGIGSVRESYTHKPGLNGSVTLVPTQGHNPAIQAGFMTVQWSYSSPTHAFLYNDPPRVRLRHASSNNFDSNF